MTTLAKNYGLITIENKFLNDPRGIGIGYFNDYLIEFEAQTRKTVVKYQEKHSLWHCEIMTKKQLDMSEETSGLCTIQTNN